MRKAIELPTNAIVIFIIGVTVLLAIMYFFFSAYQNTSPSLIKTANKTSSDLESSHLKMKCVLLTQEEILNKCSKVCSSGIDSYKILYDEGKIECKCKSGYTQKVEC